MSDSRLGIGISATDTASATIKQLQTSVKALETSLTQLGSLAAKANDTSAASIHREIAARQSQISMIKSEIAARGDQSKAIDGVTRSVQANMSALASQAQAADRAHQSMMRVTSNSGSSANSTFAKETKHFVAAFDELARGQKGAFFGTMGAAARDAGFGIAALTASVVGLVAIMGGAALLHGADAMGKWAEETKASAAAVGMSIEEYSLLQGALALVGTKADVSEASLRKLTESMSTSSSNPSSKVAEAFHNLGISQEQLAKNGGNVVGMMHMLADAFTRFNDDANKSANFSEILGESWRKLVGALENGGKGYDALIAKAKAMDLELSGEQAEKLVTTGESINKLAEIIRGNAIKAYSDWSGSIKFATETLGAFLNKALEVVGVLGRLTESVIKQVGSVKGALSEFAAAHPLVTAAAGGYGVGLVEKMLAPSAPAPPSHLFGSGPATPTVPHIPPGPRSLEVKQNAPSLEPPISPIERMEANAAKAAEIASRGATSLKQAHELETKARITEMQKSLASTELDATQRMNIAKDIANKQTELKNEQLSGSDKGAKQATTDFIAQEKLKIAEAQGNSQKIAAIYDEMLAAVGTKYKASAAQIANIEREKVEAVNKAKLQEINESSKQEEQNNRLLKLNTTLASMASGKYIYPGQEKTGPSADVDRSKGFITEAEQVRSSAQGQIANLTQIRDTSMQGSTAQKDAAEKLLEVEMNSKAQEIELYQKAGAAAVEAANKSAEAFKSFFDGMGSQFENFSSGLIKALIAPQQDLIKAGLTTIKFNEQGNEIRAAFKNMSLGIVTDLAKSLETALGHVAANLLSNGAANSIGDLLSQTLSKAVGSIFGSSAGSALGSVTGSAAGGAATSAAIAAGATTTVAGVGSSITVLGATLSTAITASTSAIVGAITGSSSVEDSLLVGLNAKPSALGFTYSQGGIVPSAAGGMVVGGTGGQLSILHAKEMVLPAPISQGIQQMIARGGNDGGNTNTASLNYSPTINTGSRSRGGTGMSRSEFGQMMALHSGAMLGEARSMIRSGWRPA